MNTANKHVSVPQELLDDRKVKQDEDPITYLNRVLRDMAGDKLLLANYAMMDTGNELPIARKAHIAQTLCCLADQLNHLRNYVTSYA